MWVQISNEFPEIFNNLRKDMELPEVLFKDPDAPIFVEEVIDPKALKGAKKEAPIKAPPLKKFKNQEEEQEYIKDFQVKCSKKISDQVITRFVFDDEQKVYNEFFEYEDRRFVYRTDYFDKLKRIKSLKDVETEGKRVMIKLHLKLDLDKYYAAKFPRVEVVQEEPEGGRDGKGNKDAKGKDKKGGKDAKGGEVAQEKIYKVEEREVEMTLEFIDPKSLEYVIDVIKRMVASSPKMILLLISFGFPVGCYRKDFSIKFIQEHLVRECDIPMTFVEDFIIDNWLENIENEIYPEGAV